MQASSWRWWAVVVAGAALLWATEARAGGKKRAAPEEARQELLTVRSASDYETTVARLEAALEKRKLKLITKLDHAKAAEKAGLDLPPTTVLIFGNPRLGTRLMQAAPTFALDLPLKMMVHEDEAGAVHVVYRPMAALARTHQLTDQEEAIARATQALASIAAEATGTASTGGAR